MDDPDEKSQTSLVRYLPLLVVACGLAFGYAMGWHHYLSLEFLAESRDSLKASVADNPLLAPLVFVLLYTPCVATVAAIRQEFGKKWANFSIVYQLTVAYLAGLIVYQIGRWWL